VRRIELTGLRERCVKNYPFLKFCSGVGYGEPKCEFESSIPSDPTFSISIVPPPNWRSKWMVSDTKPEIGHDAMNFGLSGSNPRD